MMFFGRIGRATTAGAPWASALTFSLLLIMHDVVSAQECASEIDCPINWDCIKTGAFGGLFGKQKGRCSPVSCAVGAAEALLESGFDAEAYLDDIKTITGMTRNRDFMGLADADSDTSSLLAEAFAIHPPPLLATFKGNYSACAYLNNGNLRHQRELNLVGDIWVGLQLSAAAFLSYFLKYSVYSDAYTNKLDYQLLQNCVGLLMGADVGLDLLIQINYGLRSIEEEDPSQQRQRPPYSEDRIYQCFPLATVAVVGVQVCWFQDSGPSEGEVLELTLYGASLGAAIGGYSHCFTTLTATESTRL
ncbi:unknown protein [Seminavis robusta]|uniref:Uncharacterized protein n=1 Tax=Seminavis robusta TaxID=568900 RepID=A0A9N8HJS9_9STRA|nr:unknown protein [Seminavis robusta]|eukprot:Sro787_g202340.1 n/a (304) ;mRNA; r:20750-21661